MDSRKEIGLARGTVVWVDLEPTRGHEQKGHRPCVIVSDSQIIEDQRFPMIAVIPLTGTPGAGLLYPPLEAGPSGLQKRSFALIDQLRSVDKTRLTRVFGRISARELESIEEGLCLFLGLEQDTETAV